MSLKSRDEIAGIARAGEVVARTLAHVAERVEPGVTTAELDRDAEAFIRAHPGAEPAFKGLYGFPATLCTSLNGEVVHGIPSAARSLREGDILSVDVGVRLDGLYADGARTVCVGETGPEAQRLLEVTERSLHDGIAVATAGNRIGDVGAAIQATVEGAGFSVVRELVGHGVGRQPHEEPQVPNFGSRGRGVRLEVGLVIAIEPMVNAGGRHIEMLKDGWTYVTADGSLSAHFEHTIAVTSNGPRILTRIPVEAEAQRES
ncbi:MAG: type I methionyl aminopeptidase [Gemmatimonadota bacterium]